MSGSKLKLAVLISGRGSNLQALIDAAADPAFPAEIVLVLSNVEGAYGLERARLAGIPTATIPHKGMGGAEAGRQAHEALIDARLREVGTELICLAGYMRLLTPFLVDAWHDRMINIHPALLPSYKGLHTHERALADGVRLHGCTVHYVRTEMDAGPIIVQAAVPVLSHDTPDTLAARVLRAEHKAYPLAVRLIAEGRTRVEGMVVQIDPRPGDETGLLMSPFP